MPSRRRLLAGLSSLGTLAVAGCSGGSPSENDSPTASESASGATVEVGPGGSYSFDPEEVTIGVGETVTWSFATGGHNVSARPEDYSEVSLPEGADPFASFDGDDPYSYNDPGSTFSHTFETPGEYVYVCVPHAATGMIGRVVVEA